jgi:hypothetical protein
LATRQSSARVVGLWLQRHILFQRLAPNPA